MSGCNTLTQKPQSNSDSVVGPVPHHQKAQPGGQQASAATDEQTPNDLWDLSRQHFQLDLSADNPRIERQLDYYSHHQAYLDRVTERAKRYYHYILAQVIDRGMPAELALLPVVESAYDPFAYSHGRASGPWQFIPGTAERFGLRNSWWYDGRRDIVASTGAALDYLQQLHDRFDGDWLLALAAYNSGGGTVSRAIKRNEDAGKPTDFWSLDLPRETEAYVPKLLAVAKLVESPQQYGITLQPLPLSPYFAVVDTDGQIDLAQAAKLAGTTTQELYLLNPGFNHWATDPDGPHRLLVPADSADRFREKLAALPPDQRVHWNRYKIHRGDSLSTIASRFNTTLQAIRRANKLHDNRIVAGRTLLIPIASKNASAYALSAPQRQLKQNSRIASTSNREKVLYRVRSGDSFWKIAHTHHIGVPELARWNQMAPKDPLKLGQQLVIWQKASKRVASRDRQTLRKVGYRVRSGDSLYHIASQFSVSVNDIQRWNQLDVEHYLQPGQQLTLYVDVTHAED